MSHMESNTEKEESSSNGEKSSSDSKGNIKKLQSDAILPLFDWHDNLNLETSSSDFDLEAPCLYEVLSQAPLVCDSPEKVSINY